MRTTFRSFRASAGFASLVAAAWLGTACSATNRDSVGGTGGEGGGAGQGGGGAADGAPDDGAGRDTGAAPDDAAGDRTGGGDVAGAERSPVTCNPASDDREACACDTSGDKRACWPGPAEKAGKGICRPGSQTCGGVTALLWGPCTGVVGPLPKEICGNGADDDCNGFGDCDDPECAAACTPPDVPDAPADLPADMPLDSPTLDQAYEIPPDAPPDLAPDLPPPDAPPDLPPDKAPDAPPDLPPDLPPDVAPDAPPPACMCVPGKVRWCDTPVGCLWGHQVCLPDEQWGPCTETTDRPTGCSAATKFYDPCCCFNAGECCEAGLTKGAGESIGSCGGITCGPPVTCPGTGQCMPGSERYCGTGSGDLTWGKQTCKADGSWDTCAATASRPAGCSGELFYAETCCAGTSCCEHVLHFPFGCTTTRDGPSTGKCDGIACQ